MSDVFASVRRIARLPRFAAVCAALCLPVIAIANDSSYGDDNGSIVFLRQADVSMDKETLYISRKRVEVDYVFSNRGKREISTGMAFPMPPVQFEDGDHNAISDFRLWVDGVPQKTEKKWVVKLQDGTDVSARFAASGWTIGDVGDFIDSKEVPAGKKALPADWFDQEGLPRFTLSEYFIWQQVFPVGKPVSIRHRYVPSYWSGVPIPASEVLKDYGKDSCVDADTDRSIRKREKTYGVEWAFLRYILTTANNWQGPIGQFKLTVAKDSPTQILSLCFDGELRKQSPTTFVFEARDFKPKRDLDILLID
jgi:hypothetical protein